MKPSRAGSVLLSALLVLGSDGRQPSPRVMGFGSGPFLMRRSTNRVAGGRRQKSESSPSHVSSLKAETSDSGERGGEVEVTAELLKNTAKLAGLSVSENEITDLIPEVSKFLKFVDQMNQVDVDAPGVQELPRADLPWSDPLRPDTPNRFNNVGAIWDNMPEEEDEMLKVPQLGEMEE
uniref:Glutamyl-tRNA(Gln) amidotransferase subunit C, mitochondrial n=1 Tax=Chromera velia CCMP2878 TaxID=1169474 RepID=A0A0G4IA18_9ALVE|mmetsp:Transcript_20347/g.40737  ORF Transcript_20347/g.40737 Transcript_20347/m.40737 type:complete len:178 (+) Transcript_20347:218-751(+)|eukprot:Cvel_12310.t1-p1 / transcript=Cvel_12310.t1 / gene=Cvel_12310 / organism=Chromera_velia_CCMP2878 / gene_product=Aspartyl/glutamyl-tRNA(Asn/Gln) amidotransferase, putative / transcript_product=Aspartyl/glutamyl-tRNA(Asn/Gln) amidotransferase, putative / location=Cvel_scaffold800:25661-27616(-) / protein_length=177 / sequence_SO=supercontig / SO=protein_coding / is_pseudo=false